MPVLHVGLQLGEQVFCQSTACLSFSRGAVTCLSVWFERALPFPQYFVNDRI